MSRQKGMQKTGGRLAGTPNKVTSDLRSWIMELLDDNRSQIISDIQQLEPQQRVMVFERLLPYVVPKMQTIEVKETSNPILPAEFCKKPVEQRQVFTTTELMSIYNEDVRLPANDSD